MAEGLELPIPGWWSSLLLPEGMSDGHFWASFCRPGVLHKVCPLSRPPASCLTCSLFQKGIIREPVPPSCPEGRPQLGRRPGVLGALSAVSHHALQRPSGCGGLRMRMKHPPGSVTGSTIYALVTSGKPWALPSPRFVSVGQS